MQYLTKSDVALAKSCPTKLYYKKMGYPSDESDLPLRRYTGQVRWMLRMLFQLQFQDGIPIRSTDTESASAITLAYINCLEVTLLDATLVVDNLLAFYHVLQKRGDTITFWEIKGKALDRDEPDLSKAEFRSALRDAAFKVLILKRLFPSYEIRVSVAFVNRRFLNPVEGLRGRFRTLPSQEDPNFLIMELQGSAEELRKLDILTVVDATAQVAELVTELAPEVDRLSDSIYPTPTKLINPNGLEPNGIGRHCFSCPFTLSNQDHPVSGFHECWGAAGHTVPFIGWLRSGSNLEGIDSLIAKGETSLLSVKPEHLVRANGEPVSGASALLRQVKHTSLGSEWRHPLLAKRMHELVFPLHFVDFETLTPAIPHHAGMGPYQMLAFQWSCHTLTAPNASSLIHHEWIHEGKGSPNAAFLQNLKNAIGNSGTLVVFGTHELRVLKLLLNELDAMPFVDRDLRAWLADVLDPELPKLHSVDFHAIASEYYLHPDMGNRSSLKKLVAAVLRTNPSPRALRWLRHFTPSLSLEQRDDTGKQVDPYSLLPEPFAHIAESDSEKAVALLGSQNTVRQGALAMALYEELKYGWMQEPGPLRNALLNAMLLYCRLDSLSLALLWEHWHRSPSKSSKAGRNINEAEAIG